MTGFQSNAQIAIGELCQQKSNAMEEAQTQALLICKQGDVGALLGADTGLDASALAFCIESRQRRRRHHQRIDAAQSEVFAVHLEDSI